MTKNPRHPKRTWLLHGQSIVLFSTHLRNTRLEYNRGGVTRLIVDNHVFATGYVIKIRFALFGSLVDTVANSTDILSAL